jgi:7,8-dihydroneopterin aldolase/epimerase/oxygenase
MSADRIFLKDLGFYGYHGVHAEENRLGQRFFVDIEVECDLRAAGEQDDLDRTVNYSDLFEVARDVVEGPSVALIETLAERIAQRGLNQFSIVNAITVEIRKPGAPVKTGSLGYSGVRVRRTRNERPESGF